MSNPNIKTECAVCEAKIWKIVNGKLRKTSIYTESTVELSDGSLMKVGVCNRHEKPDQTELSAITTKTHKGWLEEVALGIGNSEWVEQEGLKLSVIGVK